MNCFGAGGKMASLSQNAGINSATCKTILHKCQTMEVLVQQLQQYCPPPETSYNEKYTTNSTIYTNTDITNNILPNKESIIHSEIETNNIMFEPPPNVYQQSSSFNTYLGHKDELLTPNYNIDIFETGNNDNYSEDTSFSQTKELIPTEPIFEDNIIHDIHNSSSSSDKIGNISKIELPPTEPIIVGEYGTIEYISKVNNELPSTEPIFEDEDISEFIKFKNRPLREMLLRESFEKDIKNFSPVVVNLCSEEKIDVSTEPMIDENALQEMPKLRGLSQSTASAQKSIFLTKELPSTEPINEDVDQKRQLPALIRLSMKKELPSTEPFENELHSFNRILSQQKDLVITECIGNLEVELPPTEPICDAIQDEAIDLSVKVASMKELESTNLDIDMPKEDDTVLINNKSALVSIATTITVSQCQRNAEDMDDDEVQVIVDNKQPDEQARKEAEDMEKLRLQLPKLDASMKLERKVGEGTFSSVYLATLRTNPSAMFAVKHLTPTCHPSRIKRELQCLRDIGGKDNVSGIHICLRNQGCVVFVMPYQPHTRFHDYVLDMDAAEAKLYMRNLLIALRRVHSFDIIHRDVKPGNFLYDRENKKFLLVDFGLAQTVTSIGSSNTTNTTSNMKNVQFNNKSTVQQNKCTKPGLKPSIIQNRPEPKSIELTTKSKTVKSSKPVQNRFSVELPSANVSAQQKVALSGRNQELLAVAKAIKRKREEDNISENVQKMNTQNTEKSTKRIALQTQIDNKRNIILPFKPPTCKAMGPQFQLLAPPSPAGTSKQTSQNMSSFVRVQNSRVKMVAAPLQSKLQNRRRCPCFGKGQICELCLVRPKLVAPRAGTPGFRPPEVLLKSLNQTTAVDMWAAGVLLLSILSGCYPFFRSPDDMTALAEVMTLLGSKAIKDTAKRLDRMFSCDRERAPLDLQKLCVRLRTNRINRVQKKEKEDSGVYSDKCSVCGPSVISANGEVPCLCRSVPTHNLTTQFPQEAYDLLYKLLDPNPDTRISAEQALQHPFLKE